MNWPTSLTAPLGLRSSPSSLIDRQRRRCCHLAQAGWRGSVSLWTRPSFSPCSTLVLCTTEEHFMESDLRLVPASTLAPRRAAVETSQVSPEQGLVLVPMHGMTTITVSGKDALSFLQSKLTVDVKAWQKTGGAFGYSVDINGRVLFDVHAALLGDDRVRMISEPDLGTTIFEALDKYIIMEKVDVVVEDISEHWLVAADTAEAIDTLLGLQPSGPGALSQLSALEVLALTRSARPARLLSGESSAVRAKLVEAGARYVTWEDWQIGRASCRERGWSA